MLGTRKHRLSGENPTVGVFYRILKQITNRKVIDLSNVIEMKPVVPIK